MDNPFSLQGKTILITGASSGIGRATAIESSKIGATVIITARNKERLNETFSMLEGDNHFQFTADLCLKEDIDALVEKIQEIDGCVNNAGIVKTTLTSFITEEKIHEIINTNTIAPILLTQQLLKAKKIKKSSSIVFISSISGNHVALYGNVLYSTSKAAINGFVKNAALDLASKNIRVNSVNPGMIETSFLKEGIISEEQITEDIKKYPLKRYGKPEEVAFAIIYLLSDASSWVTGTHLLIDGGLTLQ